MFIMLRSLPQIITGLLVTHHRSQNQERSGSNKLIWNLAALMFSDNHYIRYRCSKKKTTQSISLQGNESWGNREIHTDQIVKPFSISRTKKKIKQQIQPQKHRFSYKNTDSTTQHRISNTDQQWKSSIKH